MSRFFLRSAKLISNNVMAIPRESFATDAVKHPVKAAAKTEASERWYAILRSAGASSTACTQDQATKADEATDALNSWKTVHDFFKKYAQCDDGGIAEGVSDRVVTLLAKDWAHIAVLQKLTDADQDFRGFVLRHIDMTANYYDVERIHVLARHSCPKNARRICKDIKAQIDGLDREVALFHKIEKLTQQEVDASAQKAEAGDKESAYLLYYYYSGFGDNNVHDANKSMKFLTLAANNNHAAAQIDMARRCLYNKQFDKAEEWALKAKKNECKSEMTAECGTGLFLRKIQKIKKEANQ